MDSKKLDSAVRKIYSDEALTKKFTENPKKTLEALGVDLKSVKVGNQIVPSPNEVGQVCASVCPGVPIVNACVGYTVGKDV